MELPDSEAVFGKTLAGIAPKLSREAVPAGKAIR